VPATSAAQNSLLSFFFLLRQLTKLTFITRQAVHAVKQSIFLRCLWVECPFCASVIKLASCQLSLWPIAFASLAEDHLIALIKTIPSFRCLLKGLQCLQIGVIMFQKDSFPDDNLHA
jgi:hypothetical protein